MPRIQRGVRSSLLRRGSSCVCLATSGRRLFLGSGRGCSLSRPKDLQSLRRRLDCYWLNIGRNLRSRPSRVTGSKSALGQLLDQRATTHLECVHQPLFRLWMEALCASTVVSEPYVMEARLDTRRPSHPHQGCVRGERGQ